MICESQAIEISNWFGVHPGHVDTSKVAAGDSSTLARFGTTFAVGAMMKYTLTKMWVDIQGLISFKPNTISDFTMEIVEAEIEKVI